MEEKSVWEEYCIPWFPEEINHKLYRCYYTQNVLPELRRMTMGLKHMFRSLFKEWNEDNERRRKIHCRYRITQERFTLERNKNKAWGVKRKGYDFYLCDCPQCVRRRVTKRRKLQGIQGPITVPDSECIVIS